MSNVSNSRSQTRTSWLFLTVFVLTSVLGARAAVAQADLTAGAAGAPATTDPDAPRVVDTGVNPDPGPPAAHVMPVPAAEAAAQPPCHGKPGCDMGGTDHAQVVRKWGVEVRRIATLARSAASPDPRCPGGRGSACVDVNAISVRRWVNEHYAWNAGLMLGAGGGETQVAGGTWDTHFGFGPIVGANFLLGATRHLAVSASPQAGFLAFLPSGSGSKTFMLDVRAVIEAEVHLGFIGLPNLSVGTSAGLAFMWTKKTTGETGRDSVGGVPGTTTPFSAWDMGLVGPQTLLNLVNQSFLRFYF